MGDLAACALMGSLAHSQRRAGKNSKERISDEALGNILGVLRHNQSLTALSLTGQRHFGPRAAEAMAAALRHPDLALRRLNLSRCGLEDATLGPLCTALEFRAALFDPHHPGGWRATGSLCLRSVRMAGNPALSEGAVARLVSGLARHAVIRAGLEELDLADAPLGDAVATALVGALAFRLTTTCTNNSRRMRAHRSICSRATQF